MRKTSDLQLTIRRTRSIVFLIMISFLLLNNCRGESGTEVSVNGDKWYFNDSIINKGSPAEGLLMNVRMVNSVFEDRGDKMPSEYSGFDPEKNTAEFITRIPEYVSSGVNCFTISLQGGMPGYEGSVNTAFNSDGTLRKEYMERTARVIRAADKNNAAIILSCFYQRQHSNSSALEGKDAIKAAVGNTVQWIRKNKFRNVILEVSNEYRHGGYNNWKDGKWLLSTKGQAELLSIAKSEYPGLLTGTAGMGNGNMPDSLVRVADYITIHFNNTSLEDFGEKISNMKKAGKPVICNEDDKLGDAGACACMLSVMNGCGWGYMNSKKNQTIPFTFDGIADDPAVYTMMKNVTRPGYRINEATFAKASLIITYPNDGDIFTTGQVINVRFSFIFPDTTGKNIVKLLGNNMEIGIAEGNAKQIGAVLTTSGVINLEAVVTDERGNVKLKSPKVDIIVK